MLIGRPPSSFFLEDDFLKTSPLELETDVCDFFRSPTLNRIVGPSLDDTLRRLVLSLSVFLTEDTSPSRLTIADFRARDVVLISEVEIASFRSFPNLIVLGFEESTAVLVFDEFIVTVTCELADTLVEGGNCFG